MYSFGQRARLDVMQQYAELSTCRREFLLRYFGILLKGPVAIVTWTFSQPAAPAREYTGGTGREVG
jgi:superfamily II DNA helicase RecQ